MGFSNLPFSNLDVLLITVVTVSALVALVLWLSMRSRGPHDDLII
jgi:hypothetical protein